MSLNHKSVTRIVDEYVCTHCGKSWDVTDPEPPSCEPDSFTCTARRVSYANRQPQIQLFGGVRPNAQNIPRTNMPESEVYGAYFVVFRDVATIIYASSMQECVAFYSSVTKQMNDEAQKSPALSTALTGLAFERVTSLDRHCTGRTPRVEMNPAIMAEAGRAHSNNGNQYPVVNLIEFTKHIMAVSK